MGHEYVDTPQNIVDLTAKILIEMYGNKTLEERIESDKEFKREMEKHKLKHPELYLATETGAIERFRTGQMTEDDIPHIMALRKYVVHFPDGSSKPLLG